MLPWSSSNTHFSVRHSLLALKSTGQHFSTGGRFKWWNHQQKKHKNAKNVAPSRPKKGRLFTVWELKQEGRVLPCLTLAANVGIGKSNYSLLCTWPWMTMEDFEYRVWGEWWAWVSRRICNNEDRLCSAAGRSVQSSSLHTVLDESNLQWQHSTYV